MNITDFLRRKGSGKVFIPKDFLDLGSREAVDQALSRLVKDGKILRFGRGLYCHPKINRRLGIFIPPDVDEIANALARQTSSRIVPSGAMAANLLGLSTQVPAKPVYLTDGRSRRVQTGKYVIVFKHVAPRNLPVGNRTSAMVVQALRHLGKDAIDSTIINRVRKALSSRMRSQLLRDARYTTDWIAEVVRKIAAEQEGKSNRG